MQARDTQQNQMINSSIYQQESVARQDYEKTTTESARGSTTLPARASTSVPAIYRLNTNNKLIVIANNMFAHFL